MNNRTIIAAALPLSLVAGLALAQNPPSQNPASPNAPQAPRTPTATTATGPATLAGCLYREEQVPGRKPNVAEKAGILEDYILADATIAGSTTPGLLSGSVPASGNMYKVEGPSDERLKALVGKRVEVTGKIDPEGGPGAKPGGPRPDRGIGPDQISLPEFEATSIREVAGTCPATPAARK